VIGTLMSSSFHSTMHHPLRVSMSRRAGCR
jgi:hypothetical protein